MGPPKESSSSGDTRGKENERIIISTLKPLKRTMDDGKSLVIGSLELDKPAGVRGAPQWKREVCLDIIPDSYSLKIMRLVSHPNVLRLESSIGTSNLDGAVVVEKYTSNLFLFICGLKVHCPHVILQPTIRQIIEGLYELILNGLYHGNLDVHTTYLYNPSMSVKLANFKEKVGKDTKTAQYEDWNAVGDIVEQLSTLLQSNTTTTATTSLDYFTVMDDLAHQLKIQSSQGYAHYRIKENALAHVFFWTKMKRTSFFIYGILKPLHDVDVIADISSMTCISLNWTQNDHDGLLRTMNQFRKRNKLASYGNSRHDYILFVNAAYTHQDELEINVDDVITNYGPHLLFFELVSIVRKYGYVT